MYGRNENKVFCTSRKFRFLLFQVIKKLQTPSGRAVVRSPLFLLLLLSLTCPVNRIIGRGARDVIRREVGKEKQDVTDMESRESTIRWDHHATAPRLVERRECVTQGGGGEGKT